MVKHLKSADLFCAICENKSSQKGPVISCKNCCRGFHRQCHRPVVPDLIVKSWFCRRCASLPEPKKEINQRMIEETIKKNMVHAVSTPSPKATKSTSHLSSAKKFRWDTNHLNNSANEYCYCKKDGFWMDNMVQCRRCCNWFHSGCVKSLKKELHRGDHFYIFVCSVCNPQELLVLLPFSWLELVYSAFLDLFYSPAPKVKSFLHVEETVIPHINLHWGSYRLTPEVSRTPPAERRRKIFQIIREHNSWFKWGREEKQSLGVWKMKFHIPPLCHWILPPSMALADTAALREAAQREYLFIRVLNDTPRSMPNAAPQSNGGGVSSNKRAAMMRGSVQQNDETTSQDSPASQQNGHPGKQRKRQKLNSEQPVQVAPAAVTMPPIIRKRGRPFKKLVPLQAIEPQPKGRRKAPPNLQQVEESPLEELCVDKYIVKAVRVTNCGMTQYLLELR